MGNKRNLNSLMRLAAGLLMLGGVSAAVMVMSHEARADEGDRWHKVKVLGYESGPEGITFQVPTGGCLKKKDFVVELANDPDYRGINRVILITNKADSCRKFFPYGAKVHFSYDEVGVQEGEGFIIDNGGGIVRRAGYVDVFIPVEHSDDRE